MIHYDEILELACMMLHVNYDQLLDEGYDESYIDDMFYEEYNVTLEDFEHIIKDLIKFTQPWKSYITGDVYQGFVTAIDDKGLMRAIVKEKYDNN